MTGCPPSADDCLDLDNTFLSCVRLFRCVFVSDIYLVLVFKKAAIGCRSAPNRDPTDGTGAERHAVSDSVRNDRPTPTIGGLNSAWRREARTTPSDRKHQSASDEHGRHVEQVTRMCVGAVTGWEMRGGTVKIKPKPRIPVSSAAGTPGQGSAGAPSRGSS